MPLSLSTAVGQVHEQPTPLQGVALIPQQKTGAQCGAYGWWQEFLKHNNNQQQHVSQPAADCKVVQKWTPFGKRTPLNV